MSGTRALKDSASGWPWCGDWSSCTAARWKLTATGLAGEANSWCVCRSWRTVTNRPVFTDKTAPDSGKRQISTRQSSSRPDPDENFHNARRGLQVWRCRDSIHARLILRRMHRRSVMSHAISASVARATVDSQQRIRGANSHQSGEKRYDADIAPRAYDAGRPAVNPSPHLTFALLPSAAVALSVHALPCPLAVAGAIGVATMSETNFLLQSDFR